MCSVAAPTTDVMSSLKNEEVNSSPEAEARGTKRKISLSSCGVCGTEEAKYRCPACLANSCSLQCVKKHKEDLGCSGVRNKTAFVALSRFDEMALLSDYRFLEDTGRFSDGASRDHLVRAPHGNFKKKKLAASARKMNITLRVLPITFTKSKENSTVFLTNRGQSVPWTGCLALEKLFLWHLKLIFPQSSTEFSQRRVSDKQTLEQVLTAYIHPTESDPVTRQKLKMYVHPGFDHVKVFMKAEGRKANSVRYHELDIHKSLRDNLSYKTLIEYPILHVVLRDHWKDYPPKGPAERTSACGSLATEGPGREEDVTHVSPSLQGLGTARGADIWTATARSSGETEPPQEKRAKRDAAGEEETEEQEEGEILESSEGESTLCDGAGGAEADGQVEQ